MRRHSGDSAAEPVHEVKRVYGLIYQHSAALGGKLAAPVAALIVVGVAPPCDNGAHTFQSAVFPAGDNVFEKERGAVISVLKAHAESDAGSALNRPQFGKLFCRHGARLLTQDADTLLHSRTGHGNMQIVRGADVKNIRLFIAEQAFKRCESPCSGSVSRRLRPFGDAVGDTDYPRVTYLGDCSDMG